MRNKIFIIFAFLAVSVSAQVYVAIPEIAGNGNFTYSNRPIVTSGVVTAKLTEAGVDGFVVQDKTGDGNPNTSDGIFVYSQTTELSIGDEIQITATVGTDETRVYLTDITQVKLISRHNTVTPVKIKYSVSNPNLNQYRGMLVEFDQILWVNNNYYLSNQGELELGVKRKPIPTNLAFPKTSEYTALVNENALAPVYLNNVSASVRMGERVDNLQGVLTYVSGKYILTPSQTPVVFYGNPRKREHDAIGNYNLKVCGFNLEYYLTSPNSSSMGPRTQAEMNRQHAKIVDALLAIDADVYGLVEIEQGQAALSKLVQALNTSTSSARYGYVADNTSVSGTYTKAGYLYRSDKVTPYNNLRTINSPTPLFRKQLQAFTLKSNNERFIFSINHFKAKSGCNSAIGEDADKGDGQSCYNYTRVLEAKAVINNANSNKGYYGDDDVLVMGDLNAYAKEDPITAFINEGYTDMLHHFHGDSAYSYVYRGEAGYLDHALANESMKKQVTGVVPFHINTDEESVYGYSGSKYRTDMFRSSDHDPIIVGIALGYNSNGTITDEDVKIYPTVVSDVLNIDVDENAIVQVFSINGVKLYDKELIDKKLNIKNINLIQGAYIVRVLNNNRITQQVIFVK